MRFGLRILVFSLALVLFSGCQSWSFYSQAALGQIQIYNSTVSIRGNPGIAPIQA